MTDTQIQRIISMIHTYTLKGSRSWSEYERGKRIFDDIPMQPWQYQYLIDKLTQWVGV